MLFDLFLIAKLSIIFITPNIFLLFIENLCCCSLKIAVCVPKIPIGRKKLKIPIRLKISVRSENPYLKISVHQWANRPEWCKCSGHLKGLQADRTQSRRATKGEPERCRNTRPQEKGVRQNKFFDCGQICTRSIKKCQKNLEIAKKAVTLQKK